MRISVRSLRRWRIISCPAANGLRCVKPSIANVEPSCTSAAIASRIVVISARNPPPNQLDNRTNWRTLHRPLHRAPDFHLRLSQMLTRCALDLLGRMRPFVESAAVLLDALPRPAQNSSACIFATPAWQLRRDALRRARRRCAACGSWQTVRPEENRWKHLRRRASE
jgi:hypothetical protein